MSDEKESPIRGANKILDSIESILRDPEKLEAMIRKAENTMFEYTAVYGAQSIRIGRLRHEDIIPVLDELCQKLDFGRQTTILYVFSDGKLWLARVPKRRLIDSNSDTWMLSNAQVCEQVTFDGLNPIDTEEYVIRWTCPIPGSDEGNEESEDDEW